MRQVALASYPPSTIEIDCLQQTHRLRWQAGDLIALDHHDPALDRSLDELTSQTSPCLDVVDAWTHHADDLKVLLLGPRATTDKIVRLRPDTEQWPFSARPDTDLLAMLTISPVLSRLLVCTVADKWAERMREHDLAVDEHHAALSAALFGRVVPAVRSWLDDDNLEVRVHMTTGRRELLRYPDRVEAFLPFDWIIEVWGLAPTSISGSFAVGAVAESPNDITLATIAADFLNRATVTIKTTPAQRASPSPAP